MTEEECVHTFSDAELGAWLPLPAPDAHKYTRGRVLVVAGSRRYSGAALLATGAAVRSGAGYVTLATIPAVAAAARVRVPTAPVVELPQSPDGGIAADDDTLALLCELGASADAVLLGPGLGREPELMALVRELVARLSGSSSESASPALVLDADALFAISSEKGRGMLDALPLVCPLVLTPHAKELERLIGSKDPGSAAALACGTHVVVAKGPRTCVYAEGRAVGIETGAPASLATAGSGDVLAGIIVALLAQGLSSIQASLLGVRLQTKAALAASATLTEFCMTARDLIDYVPAAAKGLLTAVAVKRRTEGEEAV